MPLNKTNKTYYEVLNLSDPNKRSQYDEYLSFIRVEKDAAQPDAASDPDYSNMSFEDYAGHTAFGAASAWQDAFDVKPHTFDEEGYKEYVKKNSTLNKEVNAPKGFIVIALNTDQLLLKLLISESVACRCSLVSFSHVSINST